MDLYNAQTYGNGQMISAPTMVLPQISRRGGYYPPEMFAPIYGNVQTQKRADTRDAPLQWGINDLLNSRVPNQLDLRGVVNRLTVKQHYNYLRSFRYCRRAVVCNFKLFFVFSLYIFSSARRIKSCQSLSPLLSEL